MGISTNVVKIRAWLCTMGIKIASLQNKICKKTQSTKLELPGGPTPSGSIQLLDSASTQCNVYFIKYSLSQCQLQDFTGASTLLMGGSLVICIQHFIVLNIVTYVLA